MLSDRVTGTMQAALKQVVGELGSSVEVKTKSKNVLNPNQQLERFFRMTDNDLENLRQKVGDYEYKRYTNAMLKMASQR